MKSRFIRVTLFIVGFVFSIYPVVKQKFAQQSQNQMIHTYEEEIEEGGENVSLLFEEAIKYNQELYELGLFLTDQMDDQVYNNTLNITEGGIMGSIDIPKIDVKIPVYHGTDEMELQKGVGHLKGSSLPTGGKNTRCILTGHRGLPNAELFTRLDELKKKDKIYLHICNHTLAYEVTTSEVIEPENMEALMLEEGEDLVSLVTCTPYGINTHRLIITGRRVPYDEKEYQKILPSKGSARERFFLLLPAVYLGVGVTALYKDIKRRRKHEKKQRNL